MKKKLVAFPLLFSVLVMACNDGGDSSTTTDSATTTTTDTTAGAGTTANQVGETDRTFLMDVASGGMHEVELGRVAQEAASHERVKNFANMMIQDHTNANNELKGISSTKNVMLPDSMMTKHREHLESMRSKTGRAFDKAYMQMMVQDHNETISKFQDAANNAQDPDVKAFASKTLPVLQKHLDSAKAINAVIK